MVLPEGVRSARAPANRWMGLGCRAPAVPTGLGTALQGDQVDRPNHASHADQVQMPRHAHITKRRAGTQRGQFCPVICSSWESRMLRTEKQIQPTAE